MGMVETPQSFTLQEQEHGICAHNYKTLNIMKQESRTNYSQIRQDEGEQVTMATIATLKERVRMCRKRLVTESIIIGINILLAIFGWPLWGVLAFICSVVSVVGIPGILMQTLPEYCDAKRDLKEAIITCYYQDNWPQDRMIR